MSAGIPAAPPDPRERRPSPSSIRDHKGSSINDVAGRCGGRPSRPPSPSRISSTPSTSFAPSLRSACDPRLRADRTFPGTAMTSRPCSSADRAVMSDPLFANASMTTTAIERPLMMRFRSGKCSGRGPEPGGMLAQDRPRSNHLFGQVPMLRGIDDVGARTEHGNRRPAAASRRDAPRRPRLSPGRSPPGASPREILAEPLRDIECIRSTRRAPRRGRWTAGKNTCVPTKDRRRIVNGGEPAADKAHRARRLASARTRRLWRSPPRPRRGFPPAAWRAPPAPRATAARAATHFSRSRRVRVANGKRAAWNGKGSLQCPPESDERSARRRSTRPGFWSTTRRRRAAAGQLANFRSRRTPWRAPRTNVVYALRNPASLFL